MARSVAFRPQKRAAPEKTVSEVLAAALDTLRTHGRATGTLRDHEGRYCTLASIHLGSGGADEWQTARSGPAVEHLASVIATNLPAYRVHLTAQAIICQYNNNSTTAQVEAMITRAINDARRRERRESAVSAINDARRRERRESAVSA